MRNSDIIIKMGQLGYCSTTYFIVLFWSVIESNFLLSTDSLYYTNIKDTLFVTDRYTLLQFLSFSLEMLQRSISVLSLILHVASLAESLYRRGRRLEDRPCPASWRRGAGKGDMKCTVLETAKGVPYLVCCSRRFY
jgi:hypothetical protein